MTLQKSWSLCQTKGFHNLTSIDIGHSVVTLLINNSVFIKLNLSQRNQCHLDKYRESDAYDTEKNHHNLVAMTVDHF